MSEIEHDGFEEFWQRYPRRTAKLAARKAYAKARRIASAAEILAGVDRYRAIKPSYADYCHPATWLNQGRWMDEPDTAPDPDLGPVAPAEIARFLAQYVALYAKYRFRAKYLTRPTDAATLRELLTVYRFEELEKMAIVLLTTDEPWTSKTDRGIRILSEKASQLHGLICEYEAQHGEIRVA